MFKCLTLLAILALITLSSAARTSIASETAASDSLRSSLLQLKANPNWILNRAAKFLRGGDRQTSADFLLGFFLEIKPIEGTVIVREEFAPCIQPDDELHELVQKLIASAVSYAQDTSRYDDYHRKITQNLSVIGLPLGNNLERNCPETKFIAEQFRKDFSWDINILDEILRQSWDQNKPLIDAFFTAFAGKVNANDYKHAIANGILAIL